MTGGAFQNSYITHATISTIRKKTIDSLRVETVNLRCKAFHLQTTNITTYLQHKNVNDETLNIC